MSYKNKLLSCASAMALALALGQSVQAEEAAPVAEAAAPAPAAEAPAAPAAEVPAVPAAPTAEAPVAPAPAAAEEPAAAPEPPTPPQSAKEAPQPPEPPKMGERRAAPKQAKSREEMREQRRAELAARYADLRSRAQEAGVELPETPPWEQKRERMSYEQMREHMKGYGADMPEAPMGPPMSMEERKAMHEKMMQLTPEEREAVREQHYQAMRERAKAQGIEMPELPPWKRPQQMPTDVDAAAPEWQAPPAMPEPDEQWEHYRDIIAGMTPEEREACMAMQRLQAPVPPMRPPMMPRGYGYGPAPKGYGYGPRWEQQRPNYWE